MCQLSLGSAQAAAEACMCISCPLWHSRDITTPCSHHRAAQVKRTQLERWFDKPFFDRCLPGCFVKVPLGEETDPRTGEKRPRYVLLRVLGFTTGTTYKLGEGKSTKTYLQCQDGGFPKNKIMMSTVSEAGWDRMIIDAVAGGAACRVLVMQVVLRCVLVWWVLGDVDPAAASWGVAALFPACGMPAAPCGVVQAS
jgi:hypothetical protein